VVVVWWWCGDVTVWRCSSEVMWWLVWRSGGVVV